MTDTAELGESAPLRRLRNAHHIAYRCRDAEQTRWFYEDVLGLPLAIALALDEILGSKEAVPFLHLFFELGNGDFIAFFDEPEAATPQQFERAPSFDRHIALQAASEEELLAWQARINAKGISCLGPVDHDFVSSVYMYDPNGLQVEITARTANHDEIVAKERRNARQNLAEWTERSRDAKVAKFGASAIDMRSRQAGRRPAQPSANS